MRKVIYISFLGLSFFSAAQAQDSKDSVFIKDEQVTESPSTSEGKIEQAPVEDHRLTGNYQDERPDTSLYFNNLNFPEDSVQRWKDLREFAYAKYLDSLLKDKQKAKVKVKPGSASPGLLNSFLASSFIRVLLWTLAVLFILFVLYRLFLAEGVFRRESKTARQQTAEVEEEIITGESDFDNLISQALQTNNYRQAVRYQYLKTLHRLADKDFVELARDKTNFQYVREIKNPAFQNDFASLTLNYEYVWYGEFMIGRNVYQKIEAGFNGLNQKI